jgi:hypothetical protein
MALVVKYIPEPEWFQQNLLSPQPDHNSDSDTENLETNETSKTSGVNKNRKFFVTGIIIALGRHSLI